MTIQFIGAGPGDPELITVKGQRLLQQAPVVLYAGSLISAELLDVCRDDAERINTAELDLLAIFDCMKSAHQQGKNVARLQCGDPSFYSAIAEQIRLLQANQIPYEIVPGVSTASAAAAALGCELTLPGQSQTVVYTRYPGKTPFPSGQSWACLAHPGTCLAIYLSVVRIHLICADLIPIYGPDCPVAVLYRVSWPEQLILNGTLSTITEQVRQHKISRSAIILVGEVLGSGQFQDSFLYAKDKAHIYRPKYGKREH